MNRVRLAVIGAGLMGERHAQLVHLHDRCCLVGICDTDPDRKEVADRYGVPFYMKVEELIEREKPSGAIIATPNPHHAAVVEICAKRSVDVLIEKPIADSIERARHIDETAKNCRIQVLVGHHRRHNTLILKARELVRENVLGKLIGVSVLWALMKPDDYFQIGWRTEKSGGGPTLINLVHDLDSLRFICGEIKEIYAQSGSLAFPAMEMWRYKNETPKGWQHPMAKVRLKVDPGDPLKAQLEHFCRVIERKEEPLINAEDGTRSLAAALAVKASTLLGLPVDPATLLQTPSQSGRCE